MVCALTRSSVSPSSKLTSAAISNVHKLLSLPKFLGLWLSISRKASARWESKARLNRMRPARTLRKGLLEAALVELMDGVAHRLGAATQRARAMW